MPEIVQINTSMNLETAKVLEQMARDAGYDNRSAFIRLLIRREAARQGRVIAEPIAEPQKETTEQVH
jgi:metal-responsive CopG/Arc/MetJ family transcriptional regulator